MLAQRFQIPFKMSILFTQLSYAIVIRDSNNKNPYHYALTELINYCSVGAHCSVENKAKLSQLEAVSKQYC